MSQPTVLCAGEVLFDCLEVPPDPPQCFLGGAPANVACGLVKLRVSAAFLGAVGDDALGEQACAELAALGVNIEAVERVAGVPTRQVRVQLVGGDRQFVGFAPAGTSVFADMQFSGQQVSPSFLAGAQFFVTGTLGLASEPTATTIEHLVQQLRQNGAFILIDANWRPIFWRDASAAPERIRPFLAQAHFLKLAKEEAELFFSDSDPQVVYRALWGTAPDHAVVITDGDQTIHYCWHENQGELQPPAMPVVDTTGAGDGFVAGWIAQLLQGSPETYRDPQWQAACLEFATVVGALVTTKRGAIAGQPTLAEVTQWLRDHPQRKIRTHSPP
ncbi:carbohydrate kinase [Thermosynechococcus sp. PP22]|uniref:carbohydrate kinase family protein n=1 Tax=Thermosynechococcus sp. PP22 TaxID=3074082 RepID=UPI0028732097|nr:carbohydrate kinase [Thermosynechococcus sp. PP22]WNC23055.1 carbohydrate kinase [Thermosynechococcus sp. PP22]